MTDTPDKEFLEKETRFEGEYARSLLDTLYQAYRPALWRTIFWLVLGLLGRIVLLGNTNLVGYWVDSLCLGQGGAGCRPIPAILSPLNSSEFLWLLAAATGLGFAMTTGYRIAISRLSAEAVSRIYDETTLRTSRLPMSFFDRNPAGRVMTRFSSDYNNVFRIFGGPLAEFIGLTFDLTAMTLLISVASPWFLPFWALQGLLNYGVYRWQLDSLRLERRETALRRSPGIAHFAETAQGAATIRAFGKEKTFERRFSELNDSYLVQRLSASRVFTLFSLSMNSVTSLTFLVTGLACVWLAKTGRVSVGSIGVAFAYLGLSTNILQSFFEWLGQFEEAMTGLERMNEYLRLPLEPGARLPAIAKFQTGHDQSDALAAGAGTRPVSPAVSSPGASIEIRGLRMRYREDLPMVLHDIDLEIRAGERLAVIGRTGSGKTSLVQALFRLYPLEGGTIRVAGRAAESGLAEYRAQMAYITQEPTLFLGTLRENLVPRSSAKSGGDPGSDSDLVQALRRVQFLGPDAEDGEYRSWLDHPVEERGRNLSAGERQLICMARCLLQETPVVIFDEATSAVDPRSEEILTRATEEFFSEKTQIVIAHRLSTIRSCDRVLWLQNGRIHRLGPPEAVLSEFQSVGSH